MSKKIGIGEAIKKARIDSQLLQSDFAEMCGWSQNDQSNYEHEKHIPNKHRLILIAEKLSKKWEIKLKD